MKAIIGANLIKSKKAQPLEKPFEIRDERLSGFILRVQPSGARSYIAQINRDRRVTICKVGHLTPDEARDRCEKIFGNVVHGREPLYGLDDTDALILKTFINDTYTPWVKANRPKSANKTLNHLKAVFGDWYETPLDAITVSMIEDWKMGRLEAGKSPSTVLRDISSISGVLTRAVKLGKLPVNPMRLVEKPRVDRMPKVRFLSPDEEKQLREALVSRDAEMIEARESANRWRKARGKDRLPVLPHYGDHITPAVLITMNTGLRRGELLSLTWDGVDFRNKNITIEGGSSKSGHTRHIPLNDEAVTVLKQWKKQCPDKSRVFPINTSFKTAWAQLLKRAGVIKFRWHDLRHHFASRLVQAGVPLNTVRELLGHGSLAMTLRYAHLAPDQRRDAVERLML